MRTRTQSDRSQIEHWIQRIWTAILAYIGICATVGLTLIIIAAAAGAVVEACTALFLTLSVCGLGVIALLGVKFARSVTDAAAELERLHYRIDVLEAAFDAQGFDNEIEGSGQSDMSELVSATLPRDQYPRLADKSRPGEHLPTVSVVPGPEPDNPARHASGPSAEQQFMRAVSDGDVECCRRLWPKLERQLTPTRRTECQGELERLNNQCREKLRSEFRLAIAAQDYVQAARIGGRIMDLYPASRMARDYLQLKGWLYRQLDNGNDPCVSRDAN